MTDGHWVRLTIAWTVRLTVLAFLASEHGRGQSTAPARPVTVKAAEKKNP